MITCRLKGGLGNMMFQIAATEWMSHKSGFKSFYHNLDQQIHKLNTEQRFNPKLKHAHEYLNIFKNFKWPKTGSFKQTVGVPFIYTPLKVIDNTCYNGYFQSEKYFNEEFVQKLFEPSDIILKKIKEKYGNITDNSCSIHVRRGDYLKLSHKHPVKDMDYFNKAMDIIKSEKYIIFSDDIEWCKNNFKGSQYIFIEDVDYIEIFLQSMCSHNIISNSSFSWWGAYLNKNKNKKVVAPLVWFANSKEDARDIVPAKWIKI